MNSDDQAPIVSSVADVAVIAEWREVVSALLAALRRRSAAKAG